MSIPENHLNSDRKPDAITLASADIIASRQYGERAGAFRHSGKQNPELIPSYIQKIQSGALNEIDGPLVIAQLRQLLPADEMPQAEAFAVSDEMVNRQPEGTKTETGYTPAICHLLPETPIEAYVVWNVARQLGTRNYTSGRDYVPIKELITELRERFGVDKRTAQNWIAAGDGLLHIRFWKRVNGGRVRALKWRGTVSLSYEINRRLCEAGKHHIADLCRNQGELFLDLSGPMSEIKSTLFITWMENRNKAQELTMSRAMQAEIWNCSPDTIRNWEAGRVNITRNFAQYAGSRLDTLEDHATPYAAKIGDSEAYRVTWQLPNTYHVTERFTPAKRGQGQKKRIARNHARKYYALDRQPLDNPTRAHTTPSRTYFQGDTATDAFKAIGRSLRKNGDSSQPRYARLGYKAGRRGQRIGIYECFDWSAGYQQTDLQERRFDLEKMPAFKAHKQEFDAYMALRRKYTA